LSWSFYEINTLPAPMLHGTRNAPLYVIMPSMLQRTIEPGNHNLKVNIRTMSLASSFSIM